MCHKITAFALQNTYIYGFKTARLVQWYSIQCEIDKLELSFLQRLCKMPTNCLTKQIFTYRLNLFQTNKCTKQNDFVPDTFNLQQTYGLTAHIKSYLTTGKFNGKKSWKRKVSRVVERKFECVSQERMNLHHDFDRFVSVHKNSLPSLFWLCAKTRKTMQHASSAIQVLVSNDNNNNNNNNN